MIEIKNSTSYKLDKLFFLKLAKNVLKEENKSNSELSITFIKEKEIKKLNKKYLKKNYSTDVLSFSAENLEKFFKKPVLGEIVICPKTVKKNSESFDTSFLEELSKVLIHGILHLLGYNHEAEKDFKKKMELKEKYYLKKYFNE